MSLFINRLVKHLNLSAMFRRLFASPHRLHLLLPARIILLLVTFFFAVAVFTIPSCRKQSAKAGAYRQDLIQQARAVIDSLSTRGSSANYRASQLNTIRFDLAQLVSVGRRQGLLAPVVFQDALLIKANFSP